jgi:hypothetical protein
MDNIFKKKHIEFVTARTEKNNKNIGKLHPYQVLGVDTKASISEIKKKYHKQSLLFNHNKVHKSFYSDISLEELKQSNYAEVMSHLSKTFKAFKEIRDAFHSLLEKLHKSIIGSRVILVEMSEKKYNNIIGTLMNFNDGKWKVKVFIDKQEQIEVETKNLKVIQEKPEEEPSTPHELFVNAYVQVIGVVTKKELNNSIGIIIEKNEDRWTVALADGNKYKFRDINLQLIDTSPSYEEEGSSAPRVQPNDLQESYKDLESCLENLTKAFEEYRYKLDDEHLSNLVHAEKEYDEQRIRHFMIKKSLPRFYDHLFTDDDFVNSLPLRRPDDDDVLSLPLRRPNDDDVDSLPLRRPDDDNVDSLPLPRPYDDHVDSLPLPRPYDDVVESLPLRRPDDDDVDSFPARPRRETKLTMLSSTSGRLF